MTSNDRDDWFDGKFVRFNALSKLADPRDGVQVCPGAGAAPQAAALEPPRRISVWVNVRSGLPARGKLFGIEAVTPTGSLFEFSDTGTAAVPLIDGVVNMPVELATKAVLNRIEAVSKCINPEICKVSALDRSGVTAISPSKKVRASFLALKIGSFLRRLLRRL